MRVGVLGPLQVQEGGASLPLGGSRQRAVLAWLALHANQVIPAQRLLVDLWGEEAPASAGNALQAAVSRLRKVMPKGRLVTKSPGYLLRLHPGELDLTIFAEAAARGRQELTDDAPDRASVTLREALQVWRGPALADFRYEPFAQTEIVRLEEQRLVCTEDRIDADLACDAAPELVAELNALVAAHPLRERLRGQLMLALYRTGRQAEALATYRDLRDRLAGDLGLDPSGALTQLETAVLRQDPALHRRRRLSPAPDRRSAPAAAPPLARRLVTVVSIDVAASSAQDAPVDPEALHAVHQRVRAVLGPVLERHGGRLSAGSGTRLCGQFGVHRTHEDDAARAAAAAADALDALLAEDGALARENGLRLVPRFGLATAEALVGGTDPPGFVGEASRLAEELSDLADPGQILLDRASQELAAAAVQAEPAGPGRFWLRSVRQAARALPVRQDGPLLGRDDELRLLVDAVEDSARRRSCRLVCLLGEAGLGKTRTVLELAARLGDRATVLTGRCLPYGEGITFWPLRELVQQVIGGGQLLDSLERVLRGEPDAAVIADRLGRAFGSGSAGSADAAEIFWATRRLLEVLARTRPVVVVLEDLHWAEPTFLDLVESVAVQSTGAPVVLLGLARPELLERRPDFGLAASPSVIELGPLPDADAARLLAALAPSAADPPTWQRVIEAAAGNPLYLEQLAAAVREDRWSLADAGIPPTIAALLTSRLDRLGPAERAVMSTAAVIGRDFTTESLGALLSEEVRHGLHRHLQVLATKGLIQRREGLGDTEHTFRHILIQQAAYRAVPKSARARVHEKLADWIEFSVVDRSTQRIEVLGYHLEQAVRFLRELQPQDARLADLTRRATRHLSTAGEAALGLGDAKAAVTIFERVRAIVPDGELIRAEVQTGLGAALVEAGRLAEARSALDEALTVASAHAAENLRAHARVQGLLLGLQVDPARTQVEADRVLPELRGTFAQHRDTLGLCRVWMLDAALHWNQARSAPAEQAWELAAENARLAGDRRHLVTSLSWLASAMLWGPTPAPEGIARCESYLVEMRGVPTGRAEVFLHVAGLHAMQDDLPRARTLLARGIRTLEEMSATPPTAITEPAAFVALLDGDPARAEPLLRREYRALEHMGEKAYLATITALLAQALVAQGPHRHDEAQALLTQGGFSAADQDTSAQIIGGCALARILSTRGLHDRARELALQAVQAAEQTDLVNQHADARLDLARVLAAAGERQESARAAEEAVALYRVKGNLRAISGVDQALASALLG